MQFPENDLIILAVMSPGHSELMTHQGTLGISLIATGMRLTSAKAINRHNQNILKEARLFSSRPVTFPTSLSWTLRAEIAVPLSQAIWCRVLTTSSTILVIMGWPGLEASVH